MSKLYGYGYEAGRDAAGESATALRKLPAQQIPGFAGKALRSHRLVTLGWEAKQPDFGVGFWDGFYDRAEDLRRKRE